MRLFGYFGGPLVLDALVNPMGEIKPPQKADDVRAWSEESVQTIILIMGAKAAATVEVTDKNHVQLMRLAYRMIRGRKTESERDNHNDLNERIQAALAWLKVPDLKQSIGGWIPGRNP
jgi:hypothetical protein